MRKNCDLCLLLTLPPLKQGECQLDEPACTIVANESHGMGWKTQEKSRYEDWQLPYFHNTFADSEV